LEKINHKANFGLSKHNNLYFLLYSAKGGHNSVDTDYYFYDIIQLVELLKANRLNEAELHVQSFLKKMYYLYEMKHELDIFKKLQNREIDHMMFLSPIKQVVVVENNIKCRLQLYNDIDINNYEFAYYLYINNKIEERIMYSKSTICNFKSKNKQDKVKVVGFAKNILNNHITTKESISQ